MVSPSKSNKSYRQSIQNLSQKVTQKLLKNLTLANSFSHKDQPSSASLVSDRSIFKYQTTATSIASFKDVVLERFSPYAALQKRRSIVPLTWAARSAKNSVVNLGDALSPVMVSALSGLPIVHQHFDARSERLACVGTIGHALKNGTVHLWGTGMDTIRTNKRGMVTYTYQRPANTEIYAHALRGKLTAAMLEKQGVKTPQIYGDPVWFLPSIIKSASEKQYELGIIVHLSELTEVSESATVHEDYLRYQIPESLRDRIRIITTLVKPTFEAIEQRVQEITACKRIATTSLHGLVIAETYKIPCVFFQIHGEPGATFIPLLDSSYRLDARIRDFYSGVDRDPLFVYAQPRSEATDWEALIGAIDRYWQPIDEPFDAFLDSFPLPLAFDPRKHPFRQRELLSKIRF